MPVPAWIRGYRVIFAIAAFVAMGVQLKDSFDRDFSPVSFFSFFTIQSNIIGAVVLLIGATRVRDASDDLRVWSLIRGAATLYLTITGIVYGVLLAGYQAELQTTLPWVDTLLHRIMPLVMVIDWLIAPPRYRIAFKESLVWLIYPLLYCAYSLIRGPIVDWYPYPFLNPDRAGGYPGVLAYSVGIGIASAVFAWVVAWASRSLRLSVSGQP